MNSESIEVDSEDADWICEQGDPRLIVRKMVDTIRNPPEEMWPEVILLAAKDRDEKPEATLARALECLKAEQALVALEMAERRIAEREQELREWQEELDARLEGGGLIREDAKPGVTWQDGEPPCYCDGPEVPGPHHKIGCWRLRPC